MSNQLQSQIQIEINAPIGVVALPITNFARKKKEKTILELKNYYEPVGLKGKLANFFIKRKMKKPFLDTFTGLKN